MKVDFLPEPELEFGLDRHVDIRFGLMNYGPVDYDSSLAPKDLRLGIVGTNETVEGVSLWLERCRNEIAAKRSNQPNLFPKFPGFRPDSGFQSTLVLDAKLQREISPKVFVDLRRSKKINTAIREAVELFYAELDYLAERTAPHVLMCALPKELLELTGMLDTPADEEDITIESEAGEGGEEENEDETPLNFHHFLKARAMRLKIPIQLILPSTYDETKLPSKKSRPKELKQLQDEATRAWNLHTALYYKARGIPWRLPRNPNDYTTCYIGVSFYQTLDRSALLTSVAQIFNERGEGVIVRGGQARISKDDRQPHLDANGSYNLLKNALKCYRDEHKNYPARIVVHKSSTHTEAEIDGFFSATRELNIGQVDLLSLTHSYTRLFRIGHYAPLRGTWLSLDSKLNILYTRGSVEFFATYPGQYVPMPLLFRCESAEQTPRFLAQEILALTKMNWNNTQFDGSDPITMHAAEQVGNILKYVSQDDNVQTSYRCYM